MTNRSGIRRLRGSLSLAKVEELFREAFVQTRKDLRLSQERVARLLGVDRSTVERYESGETNVHPKHAYRRDRFGRHFHLCVGRKMHTAWQEAV